MKEGWTYKKLGEVCDIYNGNSINADYKKKHFYGAEGGLPFIATKDVLTIGTIDYNNGVRIPNYEEYKIAPANSVFICAEGGSAGKKFAYVERDVCFGNKLFCLNPKTDLLFGKYVYYYIQSDYFRVQFYSLLTGLIGGVSAKKFQTIEIPVPFLSEQRSIVSRLDSAFAHINALKANAEKQLAEARKLFRAELAECMRPKEGAKLSKIGSIATRITKGASPKWQGINYVDSGGALFITSENVREGYIELNPPKYVDTIFNLKQRRSILKKDDVLVNIVGASIGRAAIFDLDIKDANVNQAVALIRLDTNVLFPEYLCMFLNSSVAFEKYNLMKKDAARANLSLENIGDVELYVPSIDVQHQIVAHLDALSACVRQLEEVQRKTLAKCDALKQAMLREVFE